MTCYDVCILDCCIVCCGRLEVGEVSLHASPHILGVQ